MTKDQAIALSKTRFWLEMEPDQITAFQLFEPLLCMPFDIYHQAIEKTLGRPVWTHEFADIASLQKEYLGERPAPTMQDIIDMIPADKRIVLGGSE